VIPRRPLSHDEHGKRVIALAAVWLLTCRAKRVVLIGPAPAIRGGFVDATVGDQIAIEVESRVAKQVRGAVLKPLVHRYPKKLLSPGWQNLVPVRVGPTRGSLRRLAPP
jgi:hypothetical protein